MNRSIMCSSVLWLNMLLALFSCSSDPQKNEVKGIKFSLDDFYSSNAKLDSAVEQVFLALDGKERAGQMIITSAGTTGKPTRTVENLISKKAIGGVLLLSGEKKSLAELGKRFDSLAKVTGCLPLIFSSDAEPSLINRKIKGTQKVPNTIDLVTKSMCDSVAEIISGELLSMRIKHNFAPVLDMSPDNEAITNRTFGSKSSSVIELAGAFVETTQQKGIAATVKHFPGHGLVSGDTHSKLVVIDGEMREVNNYANFIKGGVISIMVGHIAVRNNELYNTDGLPASCSRVIVTDLLKNQMNFKGIVITDAMNMGALKSIDNASLKAVEAGCDLILMEPGELKLLDQIYSKYQSDDKFRKQIDKSVRKIIRLKLCLDLF